MPTSRSPNWTLSPGALPGLAVLCEQRRAPVPDAEPSRALPWASPLRLVSFCSLPLESAVTVSTTALCSESPS